MATDPLLDHLEKTFADAYRKEIDQEENIWRSLPFFAATLALQLSAVGQIREWVAATTGPMLLLATCLLGVAAAATMAALFFLALSVWPADFRRVAREPAFRDYADQVRKAVEESAPAGKSAQDIADEALVTIKAALAEQYSLAVDNNRIVNERRARWRTRAGLSTLASVFTALVLVALVVVTHLHGHGQRPDDRGPTTQGAIPGNAAARDHEPPSIEQRTAPADDRNPQGVDKRPHDGAPGGGTGGGRP